MTLRRWLISKYRKWAGLPDNGEREEEQRRLREIQRRADAASFLLKMRAETVQRRAEGEG